MRIIVIITFFLGCSCTNNPKMINESKENHLSRLTIFFEKEMYNEVVELGSQTLKYSKSYEDSCVALSMIASAYEFVYTQSDTEGLEIVKNYYLKCYPDENEFWLANALSRLHLNAMNYDSALFYINKAINKYMPEKIPIEKELVLKEKMRIYYRKGDYTSMCEFATHNFTEEEMKKDEVLFNDQYYSLSEFCTLNW
jgi:tetratricopeptide (TPR) repeat protein